MKKTAAHVLYHIVVILLSAAFAFFLPDTIRHLARTFLVSWSYIENREFFLVLTEVAAAVMLIIVVNSIVRSWGVRKHARMANAAGLIAVTPAKAFFGRRWMKKLKEKLGFGRNVMLISSTGFRTFADPSGDLHQVLKNCREAKVMLLDPLKDGVVARAKSLADPDITPERFREQIIRSIDFLKGLKALQKNIKLKLYREVPLVKLAILGDRLCLQHYPAGLHVGAMPEYTFRHDRNNGLFDLFYQYFVSRWFDPEIPEYDLDTDELVYRDKSGNEVRREQFNEVVMEF